MVESDFRKRVEAIMHSAEGNLEQGGSLPIREALTPLLIDLENVKTVDDYNRAIDRILEVLGGREAKNRNFSLKFDSDGSIVATADEGGSVNLIESLPPGWQFSESSDFGANWKTKKILFDPSEIDSCGFLLKLAHEMGHANNLNRHELKPISVKRGTAIVKAFVAALLRIGRLAVSPQEEKEKISEELHPDSFWPEWFVKEMGERKMASEKDARNKGLEILKQLTESGYNVFAGFNNSDEINAFINVALTTHQESAHFAELRSKNTTKKLNH